LDNLVHTLQTDLIGTGVNDLITQMSSNQGDDNGTPVTVQPFVETNQAFSPASVSDEIAQVKSTMNTFDVSTDPDKKEKNQGMNLTTQDRPIDNIRNITFQGIGGDVVRFNYPNLYEVKVYNEAGNKLILKTPTEIRDAIKNYLTGKAMEYNTLLDKEIQQRDNGYYNSYSAQFNFLGQLDPLANPNLHNYGQDPIPEDYFINQLVIFLNTLENDPEYGKQAIYGNSDANTIDEKLDMIAKLLYYQNIEWPERLKQTSVADDMTEIKNSFDINRKISAVANTYLTEGNEQGKFITPVYDST